MKLDASNEAARSDYQTFLEQVGLTEAVIRRISEHGDDITSMPLGFEHLEVRQSPIEGLGLFCSTDIEPWSLIAPARIGSSRTPAGRYINHSGHPNAFFVRTADGNLEVVSIALIRAGDEILIDYRQALDANQEAANALGIGSRGFTGERVVLSPPCRPDPSRSACLATPSRPGPLSQDHSTARAGLRPALRTRQCLLNKTPLGKTQKPLASRRDAKRAS